MNKLKTNETKQKSRSQCKHPHRLASTSANANTEIKIISYNSFFRTTNLSRTVTWYETTPRKIVLTGFE